MTTQHEAEPRSERVWRPPAGLEAMGEVQGSGLREPSYLLKRPDGQVVQVSRLLHLVVTSLAPHRTAQEVCDAVSDAYGRTLTPEGLAHLLETRLEPMGLAVADDAEPVTAPRANPLLSLTFQGTLLPARASQAVARVLGPLFWPPVVVAALLGIVAFDGAALMRSDFLGALDQLLASPVLLLVLYAVLTAGALFHETGHAAACWYGGARPGAIGVGVYLVFPAFYTDVTDSYRLNRAGRIRTDLGGLYFNVLFLLALDGIYLLSGNGLVLLAALTMHIEMLQQLVPAVRFDGYYVLADLAGVPDLFARVRPVLRSLRPGHSWDPGVTELRPGARRLVIAWVAVVVPTLTLGFGWLVWQLPTIVVHTVQALVVQEDQLTRAVTAGDVPVAVLSLISAALLVLPLAGIGVLLWRLGAMLAAVTKRLLNPRPAEEAAMSPILPTGGLTAAAFNDDEMLPSKRKVPTMGWQRVIYQLSRGTVNLGPGTAERRQDELEERLRTPIVGSRRVVVMSRKGGVGKTTMTLALGSVFSTLRGDRVVAVDANPDAGNLAHRVALPNRLNVTHVLEDMAKIDSYAGLRSYLSQGAESRLEVLASDDDPRISMALDRNDYHRLIDLLDHYYNLILLDTGTGILDSANQGLLAETDELVLVLRAGIDGGRAAALTLDWLEEHDYGDLVDRAVVVINAVRRGVGAPLDPITEHFAQRCSRVVTVPWDPALETGGQTDLSALQKRTRDSLVEVAASLADNFPMSGARR